MFGKRIKTAHVTPIKKATPLLPPDWRCMEDWPTANNAYQMAVGAMVSVSRSFGKCTEMQHQSSECSEFCIKFIVQRSINRAEKKENTAKNQRREKVSNKQARLGTNEYMPLPCVIIAKTT